MRCRRCRSTTSRRTRRSSKKFRVQFTGVGAHWLSAAIGADAVDVDNRRYFACQLPAAQPVLIIDGSQDGRGGQQLSLALDPGGNTHTGWSPHIEPASYLTRTDDLAKQAAVCLLDVPRLTDDELAALEGYVRDGGGVAFFVGSQTNRDFYNDRLYHNGEGMFPVPLALPTQLLQLAARNGTGCFGQRPSAVPRAGGPAKWLLAAALGRLLLRAGTPIGRRRAMGRRMSSRGCGMKRRWSWKRSLAKGASSRSSRGFRRATRRSAAGRIGA